MKILKGGTAEVNVNGTNRWKKFDIELDESDLQAIVVKNSLDYDKLTVVMKYKLLVKQAEILIAVEFESDGLQGDKSVADLSGEFLQFVATLPHVDN